MRVSFDFGRVLFWSNVYDKLWYLVWKARLKSIFNSWYFEKVRWWWSWERWSLRFYLKNSVFKSTSGFKSWYNQIWWITQWQSWKSIITFMKRYKGFNLGSSQLESAIVEGWLDVLWQLVDVGFWRKIDFLDEANSSVFFVPLFLYSLLMTWISALPPRISPDAALIEYWLPLKNSQTTNTSYLW